MVKYIEYTNEGGVSRETKIVIVNVDKNITLDEFCKTEGVNKRQIVKTTGFDKNYLWGKRSDDLPNSSYMFVYQPEKLAEMQTKFWEKLGK